MIFSGRCLTVRESLRERYFRGAKGDFDGLLLGVLRTRNMSDVALDTHLKPLGHLMISLCRRTIRLVACSILCVAVVSSAIGNETAIVPATDAAIDKILESAHQQAGISPTALCDDRTFLRRVSLDLIGRVPTVEEINQFDVSGDRGLVVAGLLDSDEFNRYWSHLWTAILVGRGTNVKANRETLREWFESQLRNRVPLDQVAFDLISAEGVTALDGEVNFLVINREDPVTPVSRIFLGVQLDCARCHDHPFDRWTQQDYVRMRRFFSTIQIREVSGGVRLSDAGAGNANANQTPVFLTGAQPHTTAWRREMALMTVRCQPFARAMGNRVWQLLLGRGIVNPVDGLSQSQVPSVPGLHQALADQLRSQNYDLRRLIKTICTSEAYSRRDQSPDASEDGNAVSLFAARRPRELLPEQLILSYRTIAKGDVPSGRELSALAVQFLGRSAARPGASDPLNLKRTSQGLLRELASDATALSGDLDSIYLTTLTRQPDEWERGKMKDVSVADFVYALLHCNEFVFSR